MIRVQHVGQYNLDLGSEKGERNGSAEIHLHSPMYHRKKLGGRFAFGDWAFCFGEIILSIV